LKTLFSFLSDLLKRSLVTIFHSFPRKRFGINVVTRGKEMGRLYNVTLLVAYRVTDEEDTMKCISGPCSEVQSEQRKTEQNKGQSGKQ
jgi:hypothetical protein